ncbi:hypothetical protein [Proteus mirabilis]|uniref:hypothetical protein n=1 Tax=Proteus mirabilis TaxID=584 RepID=UPI0012FF353A|nr:hypothetical protein [Proteus mirabilis]
MYIQNASRSVSYRRPCKGISFPLIPWSGLRPDTPPTLHDSAINCLPVHRFRESHIFCFFGS